MSRLNPITADRAEEVQVFCRASPLESVHIAGWLADGGLLSSGTGSSQRGWLFAEEDASGVIRALALINAIGILYPVGRSPALLDGVAAIARANPGLIRVLVGMRSEVDALWERLGALGFSLRSSRSQRLMSLTEREFRPSEGTIELVTAEAIDLPAVIEHSGAMAREESGEDPQNRNPQLFHQRISSRLARKRDFVHREGDEIVFKCNVSALARSAAQIEGVYTAPAFRRRGYGLAGTSWVTRWVLSRSERAVLLVNEENDAARALYGRLGYRDVHASRTIFVG